MKPDQGDENVWRTFNQKIMIDEKTLLKKESNEEISEEKLIKKVKKTPLSVKAAAIFAILFYYITIICFYKFQQDHKKGRLAMQDIAAINNPFYGKPMMTIGVIPFDVNSMVIYNQFLVSIGSWLRCTQQVVVYVYDVVGGMGKLSDELVKELQRRFGKERIFIKGKIIKSLKIETIPEVFERIEADTETLLSSFMSNDMILPINFMDSLFIIKNYMQNYHNWSVHYPRRDLFVNCRKYYSIGVVDSMQWDQYSRDVANKCLSRLHTVGYDVYVWNHLGINIKKAKIPPYYMGRPYFDSGIMTRMAEQGWMISTFPTLETYHLEHPERVQYAKGPHKNHPDSVRNRELEKSNGFYSIRNEFVNIRLDLDNKQFLRRIEIGSRIDNFFHYNFTRDPSEFPFRDLDGVERPLRPARLF